MHQTILAPSWILTTDHAASSYGQPVLVNRGTGEAYGPGDIVKAYPSWGFMTGAAAVVRFAKRKHLDAGGAALVARFTRRPGEAAPAVDRSGCQERVCTCHDDTSWTPGAYPNGCSTCGCRWGIAPAAG